MQHDFVLLDRSGSMNTQWAEALGSINAYVKKLADDKVDTGVTLMVFDKPDQTPDFTVVRDRITPSTWNPVEKMEVSPRGYTPLNDAIGQIVALARKGAPNGQQYDKVAIIIMTDGLENASREYTHAQAKALLDSCREKGWQVQFLGANFDNAAQAASYGNLARNTVESTTANLGVTMDMMATKRGLYGSGVAASMDWSSEEKTSLKGGPVKAKAGPAKTQ